MKKWRFLLHPILANRTSWKVTISFLGLAIFLGLFLWYKMEDVIDRTGLNSYGESNPNAMIQFLLSPYFRIALILCAGLVAAALTAMRIVGPVYRIEEWLKALEKGEEVPPLKVRQGEKFSRLAELINQLFGKTKSESQFF